MKLSIKDIILLFIMPLIIGETLLFTTSLNFWFIAFSITIPSMVLMKIRLIMLDKKANNQIANISKANREDKQ